MEALCGMTRWTMQSWRGRQIGSLDRIRPESSIGHNGDSRRDGANRGAAMITDTVGTGDKLDAIIAILHRSGITMPEAEREFRKRFLVTVLTASNWNQLKAARALGVHRNTLSRHLHELRINPRIEKQVTRRRPVHPTTTSQAQEISA